MARKALAPDTEWTKKFLLSATAGLRELIATLCRKILYMCLSWEKIPGRPCKHGHQSKPYFKNGICTARVAPTRSFKMGRLSREEPADEPCDDYDYDPGDPIPTIPRNTEGARFSDQTEIEARKDILVYNTDTFQTDMLLQGCVKLHFYAASSAIDTDFVAKLLLVHPDGRAVEIYATLLRARYRHGRTQNS